jgi:carbon storage regulator
MEGENMLVLTRKTGEGISIGDGIKIRVVEIKGGQVRLGIDAPSEFRILREEIRDKVQMENRTAADWDLADFNSIVESIKR